MDYKLRYKDEFIQLGLNIAFYRKLAGFTQETLAEAVDVSRHHISSIEAVGVHTSMSLGVLFHIAEVLEVPASKLLEIRGQG